MHEHGHIYLSATPEFIFEIKLGWQPSKVKIEMSDIENPNHCGGIDEFLEHTEIEYEILIDGFRIIGHNRHVLKLTWKCER